MKRHSAILRCAASSLAVALFTLPLSAAADVYLSATAGSGPGGYNSTEVRGNADVFDTPLRANLFVFKSASSGDAITQSAFGMDWRLSELATLGLTHNRQDNSLIDISGNSASLALMLDSLWNGKLQTRLDLKHAASAYQFNNLPPSVQNNTINQTTNTLGLSQDVAEPVTLYFSHDQYSYDHDPKQAALRMMKTAPQRFYSTRSALLTFPDSSNSFGITWRALEVLTVDISSSKTLTQLDQEQKTRRLGLDYQVTDHLNLTAAVSRVASTAVVTQQTIFPNIPALTIPAGTTVIPSSNDSYAELGLGWSF